MFGIDDAMAVVGGIGGLVGGISKAFGGGQEVSGLTLPPELEYQFINQTQSDLVSIQETITKLDTIGNSLQEQLRVADQVNRGLIPQADAIKQLNDAKIRIANAFGGSAEEAIRNGYLAPEDKQTLDELKALNAQDFKDPVLEGQLDKQKRQLEQDLARSGASGSAKALARLQFSQFSDEQRFKRTEELRTAQYSRGLSTLQARSGLRQQGFQNVMQQYGVTSSALSDIQAAAQNVANVGQTGYQAGLIGAQAGQQLTQQRQDIYKNFGQFDFSGRIQDLLREGKVGPGSIVEQLSTGQRPGTAINRSVVSSKFTQLGGQNLSTLQRDLSGLSQQQLQSRLNDKSISNQNYRDLIVEELSRRNILGG